ncbi:MAG: hypothetical protein GX442_19955 [Candidatus Riflebacteria bacterium]|nr:hypothetical protein [Candidatus Riflebacteria bacterium]
MRTNPVRPGMLLMLALALTLGGLVWAQEDLQGVLDTHEPKVAAPAIERQDTPAQTAAAPAATDPWAAVRARLQAIIDRLQKILDLLRGGSTAVVEDPGKDKGKEQDKPKTDDQEKSAYQPKGTLKPESFGYGSRYQAVYDIVEKYCAVNQKYVLSAGHTWKGYTGQTDCSGFTGHFYQMLCSIAGVPPVFSQKGWFPSSQVYKTQYTKKITSAWPPPKPRDLIKPGDIFVLDKDGRSYGHIGVFMGYDKSGNPLIAHSTTTTISTKAVRGNKGHTGVRIEPMPSYYRERWSGIYRINGTDQALDKLVKQGAK